MYEVDFYTDKDGNKPIEDFIKSLLKNAETNKDDRIRAKKILTYISALERWGTRAGMPYMKHIEGDIWELRPLRDRLLFFYMSNNRFIMIHHFFKKTQKTPKREIEHAVKNMLDHLGRSENNE